MSGSLRYRLPDKLICGHWTDDLGNDILGNPLVSLGGCFGQPCNVLLVDTRRGGLRSGLLSPLFVCIGTRDWVVCDGGHIRKEKGVDPVALVDKPA